MRIPVCKMEGGEAIPYPLPACTDIVVNLVNAFRRRPLTFTIDVAHDNIILARVEDNLPCATYALEVKGKCLGNDWRSNEYEQIQIVDNNASADYDFSELQEGENSVDMNTAIIILAPSVELSGLIDDAKATLKQAEETISKANDATEESKEATKLANIALRQMKTKIEACTTATTAAENAAKSATDASASATTAADRANTAAEESELLIDATKKALAQLTTTTATANELVVKLEQNEQVRVVAEQERVSSETTRKTNEQARIDAETARITAETKREQSAKDNKIVTEKAVADCQQAVKDAKVAIDYDPDTYSLIIATGTEE